MSKTFPNNKDIIIDDMDEKFMLNIDDKQSSKNDTKTIVPCYGIVTSCYKSCKRKK